MMKQNILCGLLSLFAFFALASPDGAQGKGHGVEVRLNSPNIVEISPGKIVTASFLVLNDTDKEEEFFENLTLPAEWQVIVPFKGIPFQLKGRSEEVRLVSFRVPADCPSGRYEITYWVRSQRDYGITDSDKFHVVVLAVTKLNLTVDQKPELVIAGDSYTVTLRVVNEGNVDSLIRLEVTASPACPLQVEPSEMVLKAKSSEVVNIHVKTDKDLQQRKTQVLKLNAKISEENKSVPVVSRTVGVEIIPRVTGVWDPYHRLPVQIGVTGAVANGQGGFQAEVSGSGSINEEETASVEFLLRGPDIQDRRPYGLRDEYYLGYRTQSADIFVGDRSYSLSPLTERYNYGRGGGFHLHPGGLELGNFYMESRWGMPKEREYGTSLAYPFSDKYRMQGNFLYKRTIFGNSTTHQDSQLYSIQSMLNPREEINIDAEYAYCATDREGNAGGHAFHVELDGRLFKDIWYNLDKIYAGKDYWGYYHDEDFTFGTVTFPIFHELRGNLSYRSYKRNLSLDPARSTSNRERVYDAGLSYQFPFDLHMSLDYEDFHRDDPLRQIDFDERTLRLAGSTTYRWVSLYASVERGIFWNNVTDTRNDNLQRYSIYATFRASDRQMYSLFLTLGDDRLTEHPERTKRAGFSADLRILNNLSLDLEYAKDDYDNVTRQERDNLYSTLIYRLPNKHTVDLMAYWSHQKGTEEDDLSFFLTYTIPLRIPVSRKTSIGSLHGRVVDRTREGSPPVANVVLQLNEATTAVTDQKGEFIFPSLNPGSYRLQVAQHSIGSDKVPDQRLPIPSEVHGGGTTKLEIGLLKPCSIKGRIVLFVFPQEAQPQTGIKENGGANNSLYLVGEQKKSLPNGSNTEELKEVRGLGNLVVELANGEEVLQQVSDDTGRFSFQHLRPGQWTLFVYDQGLPPNYTLEKNGIALNLEPGEETEVVLRAIPRVRPVRIIDEGEINHSRPSSAP